MAINLARQSAFAHRHQHGYLPQSADATDNWQPHAWVILAIQAAAVGTAAAPADSLSPLARIADAFGVTGTWDQIADAVIARSTPAAPGIDLAAEHEGMRVDYHGLLRQAQDGLRGEPGIAEMIRQLHDHLTELGRRWYTGDRRVVDEFLQLYCIESDARRTLIDASPKGDDVADTLRLLLQERNHRTDGDLRTLADRCLHLSRGDRDLIAMRGSVIEKLKQDSRKGSSLDVDRLVRDCCESEKADPNDPDTICISVDELTEIAQRHAPQDSPKGGSEAAHADGWRVIPHTSPWREGERWEVYGPNGGGSVNAGDIKDQAVRELLDALAGLQASDAEVRP